MSRCMPFPPPEFFRNGVGGDELLQQLELQREKAETKERRTGPYQGAAGIWRVKGDSKRDSECQNTVNHSLVGPHAIGSGGVFIHGVKGIKSPDSQTSRHRGSRRRDVHLDMDPKLIQRKFQEPLMRTLQSIRYVRRDVCTTLNVAIRLGFLVSWSDKQRPRTPFWDGPIKVPLGDAYFPFDGGRDRKKHRPVMYHSDLVGTKFAAPTRCKVVIK
ncbi:Exostosin family protein [Senna tora]|uniref:Exostosin family protein n=1 Tax=Senna tora TaxID=362788 RepID=A0A834XAY4_9FABA|nr:Exostosin family protein [Senna tora]